MPAERTTMRQVREVLRLKFVGGVPTREIARRIGVAPSTVRTTIRRFEAAGLKNFLHLSKKTAAVGKSRKKFQGGQVAPPEFQCTESCRPFVAQQNAHLEESAEAEGRLALTYATTRLASHRSRT